MLPIWNFFITKRQFTILVMIGLLIAGSVSVLSITKESAPEVQIPVGIVSIALPGAGAEEVERLVTNKVEAQLGSLTDLNKLTSTSRDGVSVVVAEFTASANIEESIQKLKDEVDKVKPELPDDAQAMVFPWASVMPPWEQHLTVDEIWKVVLFEYWHTGYYPRTWD